MRLDESLVLNNGIKMPVLGLGVYKSGENTKQAVLDALEAGYRHIDVASVYGNENEVGQAIRESGIPREEIFVTTKLWNDDMRAGIQKEAFEKSLERLQMDYVDLYLLHWPVAEHYLPSAYFGKPEPGRTGEVHRREQFSDGPPDGSDGPCNGRSRCQSD